MLNGLAKLKPTWRMAIIQNGSPLFAGDAGSEPSEIRRYILENDWLDAIVQLGTDQFMNTGIATYIWICFGTSIMKEILIEEGYPLYDGEPQIGFFVQFNMTLLLEEWRRNVLASQKL